MWRAIPVWHALRAHNARAFGNFLLTIWLTKKTLWADSLDAKGTHYEGVDDV